MTNKLIIILLWFHCLYNIKGLEYCSLHQCDEKLCIPLKWVCDGHPDCLDRSDELNCESVFQCTNDQFHCDSGSTCIPKKWICDGEYDCEDALDELQCGQINCTDNQFQCEAGSECHDLSLLCDGTVDCGNHYDENSTNCYNRKCLAGEITCDGGRKCILDRWFCDGDFDCDDHTDEQNCAIDICPPNFHRCEATLAHPASCISNSWLCDSLTDCDDGSDEKNCSNVTVAEVTCELCGNNSFLCHHECTCIPGEWMCDGDVDCVDSSDEQFCVTKTCRFNEHKCTSTNVCVPLSAKCDQVVDCEDFSDELHCIYPPACDPISEFNCLNGKCISLSKICDRKNDCGQYQDESVDLCSMNISLNLCTKLNGGCMHICKPNYNGSVECMCRIGFRLDIDKSSCIDIDECTIPGSCSQECKNTIPGFQCICLEGFQLDPFDHTSCLAREGEPKLIFLNNFGIQIIGSRTSSYRMFNDRSHRVISVDFDQSASALIFADQLSGNIIWSQINETENILFNKSVITNIINIEKIESISFDWINRNLYWTKNDGIYVVSVETKDNKRMPGGYHLIRKGVGHAKGLVLDPRNNFQFLFWSDVGDHPKIERTYLDGSQPKVIVDKQLVKPNCLTIDYDQNRLYWTDRKLHSVFSIDFNGENMQTILSSLMYLRQPLGMAVFENNIYWTDWKTEALYKSNKFKSNSSTVTKMVSKLHHVSDVKIYHHLKQPKSVCNCIEQCSGICLPSSPIQKFTCNIFMESIQTDNPINIEIEKKANIESHPDHINYYIYYVLITSILIIIMIALLIWIIFFGKSKYLKKQAEKSKLNDESNCNIQNNFEPSQNLSEIEAQQVDSLNTFLLNVDSSAHLINVDSNASFNISQQQNNLNEDYNIKFYQNSDSHILNLNVHSKNSQSEDSLMESKNDILSKPIPKINFEFDKVDIHVNSNLDNTSKNKSIASNSNSYTSAFSNFNSFDNLEIENKISGSFNSFGVNANFNEKNLISSSLNNLSLKVKTSNILNIQVGLSESEISELEKKETTRSSFITDDYNRIQKSVANTSFDILDSQILSCQLAPNFKLNNLCNDLSKYNSYESLKIHDSCYYVKEYDPADQLTMPINSTNDLFIVDDSIDKMFDDEQELDLKNFKENKNNDGEKMANILNSESSARLLINEEEDTDLLTLKEKFDIIVGGKKSQNPLTDLGKKFAEYSKWIV